MHTRPARRRIPRATTTLCLIAVLALLGSGTALAAVSASGSHLKRPHVKPKRHLVLAGTWSGKYSGAFSGTFTLTWTQTGSSLAGTITLSSPSGKYGITGTVSGTSIKFGVVGVTKYSGTVSGKSMSGSYTSPRGGGSWSASKS